MNFFFVGINWTKKEFWNIYKCSSLIRTGKTKKVLRKIPFAVLRWFGDFLLVAPCRLALHQKKVSSLLGELLKREVVLGEAEKALLESALCKMDKLREEIIRSGSCSYCLMIPFLFFFLLFICVIILICDLSVTNILELFSSSSYFVFTLTSSYPLERQSRRQIKSSSLASTNLLYCYPLISLISSNILIS